AIHPKELNDITVFAKTLQSPPQRRPSILLPPGFAAQSNITIEDADVEREKSYQRALEVDDKLTQMTGKLEAVVNDLNSAQERALNSGREGTNDEVGKIIGIFNAHHETLAVLDNKARAVEADMATLSQVLARSGQ
ncbi:hypothetical protein THAOC_29666, partial [Thalassiosira oceanica]